MALDDDVREMARQPFFQELEPEALRLLAFSAETKILRTGDVLFRRGDISDAGYVLLSGSFLLEDKVDTPEIVISAHSLIGEIALLTTTERPVTMTAREPCTVLVIRRAIFHRILKEYPQSAVRLKIAIENRLAGFAADTAH